MSKDKETTEYISQEERWRREIEKIVATPQSAEAFLISAGILKKDGTLADHLR